MRSDEDSYDFGVDIGDEAPVRIGRQASDKVLDATEIMATQEAEISRIADLFAIERTDAAVLLHWAKWRTERLIEQWMDDPERVARQAGLSSSAAAGAEGDDGAATSMCSARIAVMPWQNEATIDSSTAGGLR